MNLFLQTRTSLEQKYGLSPKELEAKAKNEAREIIYNCTLNENGFYDKPPKFKNRSKQRFNQSGRYWADWLLKEQSKNKHIFYSVLVEMGKKPLYSKDTVIHAKRIAKKLFKDYPCYCSIEKARFSGGKIHFHILALLPNKFIIPQRAFNCKVKAEILGSRPKYLHKSMSENVNKFLSYLMKASDANSVKKGSEEYKAILLEWFLLIRR
ncbi:hypothetical protein Q0M94_06840 [Deinococcus radiomollis]|uniref:hypothetical protein n=1 Tax=Deinococcus radiomollis TaxID=468916 RepID=UPI0038927A2F